MGDRCSVRIFCATEDKQKILKIFNDDYPPDDEDEVGGGWWMHFYECNYGREAELREAAATGLIFHGDSGAGMDYGPLVFAAQSGLLFEAEANQEGFPMTEVTRDGPEPGGIATAMRYYQAVDNAKAHILTSKATDRRTIRNAMHARRH